MQAISKKELRNFGLIMAAFIAAIFGLLFPFIFGWDISYIPWLLAILFLVFSLIYPIVLFPVYRIWTAFGKVVGWINTKIILMVVYYLMFVPIGYVMKLVRYDSMKMRTRTNQESYKINIQK